MSAMPRARMLTKGAETRRPELRTAWTSVGHAPHHELPPGSFDDIEVVCTLFELCQETWLRAYLENVIYNRRSSSIDATVRITIV